MSYEIPVLVIAFNRPDVTQKTFEYIRAIGPTKLYLAVDGARVDRIGEAERVADVKRIFDGVDWPCEVHRKYNTDNLGAEITVSSAVSWVLENEEYVVVLEDDIVASRAFFSFAQEMLIRYKDNENIYVVSGSNFTPVDFCDGSDYTFCYCGHTWGWATWKRAWKMFSLECDFLISKKELLERYSCPKIAYYKYRQFKKFANNPIGTNTWDICWSFIRIKQCGLSIVPRYNLVSNIGEYGLHFKGKTKVHYLEYNADFVAMKHPHVVKVDIMYESCHFDRYTYKSLWQRVINKVNNLFRR